MVGRPQVGYPQPDRATLDHVQNRPRRALLIAGIGAIAAGVVGCTRGIQGARDQATGSGITPRTQVAPLSSAPTTATSPTATPPVRSPAASVRTSKTTATPSTKRSGSATPTPPRARPHTGSATQIEHGPSNRPRVALTFHGAGDIAYAREILAIAKRKNAKITVMAVGTWLADNPTIGREILSAGHEIGNHTLSHLDINSLSESAMRAEVVGCRDLLVQTAGVPGTYFRQSQSPTANPRLLKVAGDAGYAVCLSYNLDSLDWTDPGAAAVRQNMLAARAGSIVSLHLGHSGTVEALPGVLDDLTGRGLSATTVSTLLAG